MLDDKRLQQIVKVDLQKNTSQIVEALGLLQIAFVEHLRAFGLLSELLKSVPHQLTEAQGQSGVELTDSLLSFRYTQT